MALIKIDKEVVEELKTLLEEQKDVSPTVRVAGRMCSDGMGYQLFIDSANENDIVEIHGGIGFAVAKNLAEACGGFTVSARKVQGETYIQVLSDKEAPADCSGNVSGCSSCSSCSSCG